MGLLSDKKNYAVLRSSDHWVVSFHAFATGCKITLTDHPNLSPSGIAEEITSWIQGFEQRYSRYLPESWITRINLASGLHPITIEEEDMEVIAAARYAYFQSKGAIDPSCLPLTKLWQEARSGRKIPDASLIHHAKNLVNWKKVEISDHRIFLPTTGMGLDFGGFGKEFAVDKTAGLLLNLGCRDFLVDFGGDLFASGYGPDGQPWKIGIERPTPSGQPKYVLALTDKALATSGNYRKFFDIDGKRYGHAIDPRTGFPTIHSQLSASVIAPSCLKSGILSTTCILEGKKTGIRLLDANWEAEGCIQSLDSSIKTNNFYRSAIYEDTD